MYVCMYDEELGCLALASALVPACFTGVEVLAGDQALFLLLGGGGSCWLWEGSLLGVHCICGLSLDLKSPALPRALWGADSSQSLVGLCSLCCFALELYLPTLTPPQGTHLLSDSSLCPKVK